MKNLTLLIPAKLESESLPIFLNEIKHLDAVKLVVLQKEDVVTQEAIKKIPGIKILIQKKKRLRECNKRGDRLYQDRFFMHH